MKYLLYLLGIFAVFCLSSQQEPGRLQKDNVVADLEMNLKKNLLADEQSDAIAEQDDDDQALKEEEDVELESFAETAQDDGGKTENENAKAQNYWYFRRGFYRYRNLYYAYRRYYYQQLRLKRKYQKLYKTYYHRSDWCMHHFHKRG